MDFLEERSNKSEIKSKSIDNASFAVEFLRARHWPGVHVDGEHLRAHRVIFFDPQKFPRIAIR